MAIEYPKESRKHAKLKYYFIMETRYEWLLFLHTLSFGNDLFLNICPLSDKSHAVTHPQPRDKGTHLYKRTIGHSQKYVSCVWELNCHSNISSLSSCVWLQRSSLASSLGLFPSFSPENSKYQSSGNYNVHRSHIGILLNAGFDSEGLG